MSKEENTFGLLNVQLQEAFDNFTKEKDRINFEMRKEALRLVKRGVKISRVGQLSGKSGLNWIYDAISEAGELTPLQRKRLGLDTPRILVTLRDRAQGIYRLDTADADIDEFAVLQWNFDGEFYRVVDSDLKAGSYLQRACRKLGADILPHPYNPNTAPEDFEKELS